MSYQGYTDGIQVILSDYIGIVGHKQVRTHHRSRINKKWRRRYGTVPIYEPMILKYDGGLLVNRLGLEKLKAAFKARAEQPKPGGAS